MAQNGQFGPILGLKIGQNTNIFGIKVKKYRKKRKRAKKGNIGAKVEVLTNQKTTKTGHFELSALERWCYNIGVPR